MKAFHCASTFAISDVARARLYFIEERPYLHIVEFAAADVNPDPEQLGLSGSPTKVKKIENVVFQAKEAKALTAEDKDIEALMQELIASHTLG